MLTKANKLPKGPSEDKTDLRLFGRLNLDYHFFSVVSLHAFLSGLVAVCAAALKLFNFHNNDRVRLLTAYHALSVADRVYRQPLSIRV